MSRRNKAKAKRKQREQAAIRPRRNYDVVEETTSLFTCSTGIAQDFAEQCERRFDGVRDEIPFTRAGLLLWRDRPGRDQLVAVLADYLAEQRRHMDALATLLPRFQTISVARSPEEHEHLGPLEDCLELVRETIYHSDESVAEPDDDEPPY